MSCDRRILLISTRMILINCVFASACEWAVMEQQRMNKREEGEVQKKWSNNGAIVRWAIYKYYLLFMNLIAPFYIIM